MLRNDDCELKLARGGWLLGICLPATAAPELGRARLWRVAQGK
jgi:hypothetical protein